MKLTFVLSVFSLIVSSFANPVSENERNDFASLVRSFAASHKRRRPFFWNNDPEEPKEGGVMFGGTAKPDTLVKYNLPNNEDPRPPDRPSRIFDGGHTAFDLNNRNYAERLFAAGIVGPELFRRVATYPGATPPVKPIWNNRWSAQLNRDRLPLLDHRVKIMLMAG